MAFNIFATATSDIPLANLDANFTMIGSSAVASTLYPTASTSITYGTAGTSHIFSGSIGAFTLSGTVAGGGNQLNNVIIGTTTPLAGAFTTLSATGLTTLGSVSSGIALAVTSSAPTYTGSFINSSATSAGLLIKAGSTSGHEVLDVQTYNATSLFKVLASGAVTMVGGLTAGGVKAPNFLDSSGVTGAVLTVSNNIQYVNNAIIGTFSSTGLAVTGTLSATGQITSTVTSALITEAISGNTNAIYHHVKNTGGEVYIGLNNSSNSGLITGGGNYATCILNPGATNMAFGVNSSLAMTLDSSGNLGVGNSSGVGRIESYINNATIPAIYARQDGVANIQTWVVGGGTVRAYILPNGGLGNFSANDVNLSDERIKTEISLANNYLEKICAIPVKTFKYKDQTDNAFNLGVIAQDVEIVAPELVSNDGFGETPEDGIPLKAIYQTDLQYALMKCIQEQQTIITALTTRITALEAK
jgi:hypothetical protein